MRRDEALSDYIYSARTAGSGRVGQSKLSNKLLTSHLRMRTAVYAIGPRSGPPVKIGFSGRPAVRLVDLQIASPTDIRFHLVCWLPTKSDATALEARCHRMLKESGHHIRGEWFSLTPIEAAKVIDRASIDVGCQLVPHRDLIKTFPLHEDPLEGCFW